jgi:transaldolase
MKLFLDSVRVAEIQAALGRRCIAGVTTNPTFLRAEAGDRPLAHLRQIVELLRPTDLLLGVQVMTTEPAGMLTQAEALRRELDYGGLVVKIPCGWNELRVVAELSQRGFAVNCTACMTATQALLGAAAGARYVTLFLGKMADAGIDWSAVTGEVASQLHGSPGGCELVAASIRQAFDVRECLRRGADAATIRYDLLAMLSEHPKTREAVATFAENFTSLELPTYTLPH